MTLKSVPALKTHSMAGVLGNYGKENNTTGKFL